MMSRNKSTTNTQTSNRAEEVRARRKKRKAPMKSARQERVKTAQQGPPVMVRGSGVGYSGYARETKPRSSASRRRYDVSLASPGAEMRLPSLPVIRLGWRTISFILVAGLLAILYYFWTSPVYTVKAAEVHGAERLSALQINQALNIVNKPIFMVDPRQLQRELQMTYPELVSVSIQIGLPATVIVNVEERTPVLAWKQADYVYWVDVDGVGFPPRGEVGDLVTVESQTAPPLPLSEEELEDVADSFEEVVLTSQVFMTPEMVRAILALDSWAPEKMSLVYDPTHGLGWFDERGWQVYFGVDAADIDTKLHLYETVVSSLEADGVKPALISVEHIHAPYYRLER
jgi:hypothetical protein